VKNETSQAISVNTVGEPVPVYENCRYCLMCRHVCPVGRVTKREANTPHGWALLIASVDRGQAQWDADAVDTLYECADCGLCQAFCVTDQPLPAGIVGARRHVVASGRAPRSVAEVDEKLRRWGNPYREMAPLAVDGEAETALFVGAAAQHLRPEMLAAARRLLEALGIAHALVGVGRSSAYLPYTLGLWDTARALGQATLDEIAATGARRVVVLTAEDAHAFGYVHEALGIARCDTVELMTLLADAELRLRPLQGALAYHDAAHTARLPDATGPARAAIARRVVARLAAEPLRELFWREERAGPDGTVGGLEFTHPALAAELTRERLADAVTTGAQVLVTEDAEALDHMIAHLDGTPIRVAGLYELMVEQLA
jgi:Fe-S oxidoreductase